jgi:hypothetical protein
MVLREVPFRDPIYAHISAVGTHLVFVAPVVVERSAGRELAGGVSSIYLSLPLAVGPDQASPFILWPSLWACWTQEGRIVPVLKDSQMGLRG